MLIPVSKITPAFVALLAAASVAAADDANTKIEFNRDVRPILSEHCFACHGPDKNHREADLRLDIAPEVTDAQETRPIVAGKPEQSELVKRVFAASDDEALMPPAETHKPLSDDQKETLKKWIEQGAQYQGHWAYEPLKRPSVPITASTVPVLRNPVDCFIEEKLSSINLGSAPQADRRTLIRRVYLDLIGLPPSTQEVEAFVNDSSPDAYQKLVDKLLASDGFAEKQTIHWLDAVRYADTVGFHGDQDMIVWPYRDYVLNAFRTNRPFDQFTREQLAGDLLPNPTNEQLTATAFNRLNRMSAEGGVQDKEYRLKYAADRVRTVSMVWMGSTLGCAECHDHKYDPFLTKDFYSMSAFFSDIEEQGFYDKGFSQGTWGPSLQLASREQQAELAVLDQKIKMFDAILAEVTGDAAKYEEQYKALKEKDQTKWQNLVPVSAASSEGAILTINPDGLVVVDGPNPDYDSHTLVIKPGAGTWTAFRLNNESDESLPGNRVSRGWKSFVISEVDLKVSNSEQMLTPVEIASVQANHDSDPYPVEAAIDGDPKTGWACEYGHTDRHMMVVSLATPLTTDDSTYLTIRLDQKSDKRHATLGRYRLAASCLPGAAYTPSGLSKELTEALNKPSNERSPEQQQLIQKAADEVARASVPTTRQRAAAKAKRRLLAGSIPNVLITKKLDQPRMVRILPRGNWMDESGEVVEAAVPSFLNGKQPPEGEKYRATRLDLAAWLTSQENPLTARTMVNRWWYQFFGAGLSKQLEDIGSQGSWPTHPELLDWLAMEFIEPTIDTQDTHAWDIKHLVRLIVTSDAYQRSSVASEEQLQRDLSNHWLARQSPIRLDAEVIRDSALANSGLLVRDFGGPSVRPYQPSGYWLALNYPKQEYPVSFGEDRYRRSVYMHWQRTFLHPSLLAFDAATREECQVARTLSNTPQQAFVLLNDPMYLEMTVALAARTLKEGGKTVPDQIAWQFQQVLGRPIAAKELEVLKQEHAQQHDYYSQHRDAATQLLAACPKIAAEHESIDLAAMTMVSRIVFNLHETITRD